MDTLSKGHSVRDTAPAEQGMPELKGTVFVVDDDVSVREALQSLVGVMGWDVLTFASAEDFLACPPAPGPSCLVLDVSLPDLNGLDLQTRVSGDRSEMPIIFITGFADVPMSVRAMKAGAAEFLTKPFGDDELVRAIEAALDRSGRAVGEQTAQRALQARYDTLSRRERQVMALVTSGLLNKQV